MDIKKVEQSLESNKNLTDELRINFLELIAIFHKNFKEVPLDNLCNRLETLVIERGNKFINKDALYYNCKENILSISEDLIKEEPDVKHALMVAILKMITAKDNFYGIGKDEKYTALNIGIAESIADFLVGYEGE